MSSRRKNVRSPELRHAIKKRGVDAVKSDEESEYLDEAQQELFVKQMTVIVDEYIAKWKSMFAWLSLVVLYVHAGCLIGIFPLTRWITSIGPIATSQSIIFQTFCAPLTLGTAFYPLGYFAVMMCLLTITGDIWIIKICMGGKKGLDVQKFRIGYWAVSLVITVGWMFMATVVGISPLWGKHTVIIIATPLLGYAGETYISSRSVAMAGLEKLDLFKYSHKKL
jgi:hypothetical protein